MQNITNRNKSIDIIRGIAIVIMFYAHLLPHFSGFELSIFERITSSLAAPIFLFLVGYNFSITTSFASLLKRVLIIFIFASLIDIFIWNVYPFYSFDVLYTIGISLIFLFIMKKWDKKLRLIILVSLLLSVILIDNFNLYRVYIDEPYLGEKYSITGVFYNLFIGGWFPIFPWLFFPLAGNLFKNISLNNTVVKIVSLVLFISLFSLFCVLNYNFNLRPFAVEIFYPANIIYFPIAIVFITLIMSWKSILETKVLNFLSIFGKLSLFLYFSHLFLYHLFADLLIKIIPSKLTVFAIFLCFNFLIGFLIEYYKRKWVFYNKSEFVKIILGK
jgi:uncharacterized membrane protein